MVYSTFQDKMRITTKIMHDSIKNFSTPLAVDSTEHEIA